MKGRCNIMDQSQNDLRKRLNYAIDEIGLKAKTIGRKTNIAECELSRFKNGKAVLCQPDVKKLTSYLDNFFMVEL